MSARPGGATVAVIAVLALSACGTAAAVSPATSGTAGGAVRSATHGVAGAATMPVAAAGVRTGSDSSPVGPALTGPGGAGVAMPGGAEVDTPPNPVATPESSSGGVTVTTDAGTFVIAGSTCRVAGDSAAFLFGVTGSGEEVEVSIQRGYRGPGTYGSSDAGVAVTVGHGGRAWYAQYSSEPAATLTIDPGERSGVFAFDTQIGNPDHVTGRFTCG